MREAVDIPDGDAAGADLHQGKISYSLFCSLERTFLFVYRGISGTIRNSKVGREFLRIELLQSEGARSARNRSWEFST
jgi:hypothetical protein